LKKRATPDFVVCPDEVAKGHDSLMFSVKWIRNLPAEGRYYLAVQDGMSLTEVELYLKWFSGLFVGGSLDWKLATSPEWVALAHKHQKPCHIGRVGTWNRIVWAARISADSIDSTSWAQNDSYHHLEYAKMQHTLEVK
jgi:hypothetical protein